MSIASVRCAQVIVEVASGSALAGLFLFLQPWDSDADCEAAEHAKDMSGFWCAHATAVFVEGVIKPVGIRKAASQ